MVERGEHDEFALLMADIADSGVEELDGDLTTERLVVGTIDGRHPAAPDDRIQTVPVGEHPGDQIVVTVVVRGHRHLLSVRVLVLAQCSV